MQLSLMDLKLLKIGYMKKFIKKVGFILSIPKAYNKDEWITFNSTKKIKVNEKKKIVK